MNVVLFHGPVHTAGPLYGPCIIPNPRNGHHLASRSELPAHVSEEPSVVEVE